MYARHALVDKDGQIVGQPIEAPINLETTTIQDIAYQLRRELEGTDGARPAIGEGMDYCSVSSALEYTIVKGRYVHNPGRRNQPIGRYRWIACYAVTGGSEGHYVHVDRIWDVDHEGRHLENLITIKTFGGYEEACAIAAYVGRRLDA